MLVAGNLYFLEILGALMSKHVVIFFSRSLQRALDRRLYLLLYGNTLGAPGGKPVWHFPEKVYESEDTLRKVMAASSSSPYLFVCFFSYKFLCFSVQSLH